MKILITGATGFLGKHLVSFLGKLGHEVDALGSKSCDLTNDLSLRQFNHKLYDQIFHLAAWTQAGDFCLYHPGEQWVINQKINTNLLAWWNDVQPQAKLICIGTSCSYDPELPLSEDYYLIGKPIKALYTYAMTKRMLLVGIQAIAQQYGQRRYLYCIPSTLYGSGYHKDGRQMHFIFDLARKILDGKRQGKPVVLWGDGYQRRELIHVLDFIENMVALAKREDNQVLNIGAGEECTIREYAQLICSIVGYDFEKVQFDTTMYVGAKSKCLDISRARSVLGESYRRRAIRGGLEELVEWYANSFD